MWKSSLNINYYITSWSIIIYVQWRFPHGKLASLRGNHQCVWFSWNNFNYQIICLGQILLSYILQTHHAHTHACTQCHTRTHVTVQVVTVRGVVGAQAWQLMLRAFCRFRWRSMAGRAAGRCFIQMNTRPGFSEVLGVFRVYKNC